MRFFLTKWLCFVISICGFFGEIILRNLLRNLFANAFVKSPCDFFCEICDSERNHEISRNLRWKIAKFDWTPQGIRFRYFSQWKSGLFLVDYDSLRLNRSVRSMHTIRYDTYCIAVGVAKYRCVETAGHTNEVNKNWIQVLVELNWIEMTPERPRWPCQNNTVLAGSPLSASPRRAGGLWGSAEGRCPGVRSPCG